MAQIPSLTIEYARILELKMPLYRDLLRKSMELLGVAEMQDFEATGKIVMRRATMNQNGRLIPTKQ